MHVNAAMHRKQSAAICRSTCSKEQTPLPSPTLPSNMAPYPSRSSTWSGTLSCTAALRCHISG